MSLFERLNNKRYDLQEKKKKFSSSASSGNNNSDQNISTSRRNIKKAISDLEATQPNSNEIRKSLENRSTSGDGGQRRTVDQNLELQKQRAYQAYDDSDAGRPTTGNTVNTSTKTKTKTKMDLSKPIKDPWFTDKNDYPDGTSSNKDVVKQSKVSKDASKFTDRVNRANKNRKEFIKGRQTYTDSKTGIEPGKPTKKGIVNYIAKARNKRQGTNVNTKLNKKAAEVISKSSGKEYADKITKKYETDKRMIRSRKPRKTVEQLKKEIEIKSKNKKIVKKIKNIVKTKPSTSGLYDPFKNKIPKLDPLKPLRIPKLKPSVITKTASKSTPVLARLAKAGMKNPKTALAVGLLGLGLYGANKNRIATNKLKKNKMLPPIGGGSKGEIVEPKPISLYLQSDPSRK